MTDIEIADKILGFIVKSAGCYTADGIAKTLQIDNKKAREVCEFLKGDRRNWFVSGSNFMILSPLYLETVKLFLKGGGFVGERKMVLQRLAEQEAREEQESRRQHLYEESLRAHIEQAKIAREQADIAKEQAVASAHNAFESEKSAKQAKNWTIASICIAGIVAIIEIGRSSGWWK